jgi:uncharacterized membrane protein AbrB (regulator of aidB expression)
MRKNALKCEKLRKMLKNVSIHFSSDLCLESLLRSPGGVEYVVVIASDSRTEDPGFESLQCARFLGLYTLQCCCQNLMCIVIVCI